jgi:hypothetical protein
VFWSQRRQLEQQYPTLKMIHRQRLSLLLYPLTGGFQGPSLAPNWAAGFLRRMESALTPLAWLLAFRCLVVLEKTADTRGEA